MLTATGKLNEGVGDFISTATPTTFSEVPATEKLYEGKPMMGLIFPGFNASPESLEAHISPALMQYGNCITAHYGVDILSTKQLTDHVEARLINSSLNSKLQPRLVAYAHSAGGIISRPVLRELTHRGYEISSVYLDCTPAKSGDISSSTKRTLLQLMALGDRLDIQGGPISRAIFESIGHGVDTMNPFMIQDLVYGIQRALPKSSPHDNRVVEKTAVAIVEAAHAMHVSNDPLEKVPHLIFGPHVPKDDRVIDRAASRTHWRELVPKLAYVDVPQGNHGVSWRTKKFYVQEILKRQEALGISTISERNKNLIKLGWPRQTSSY